MLRRVPRYEASDLDHLERMVAESETPLILVFDADNTLVPQGVSIADFRAGVGAAVERFASLPDVERVVVLTNGPDRGVPNMIHRGNKPWTTRGRLGLRRNGAPVWVVGDQVLTDGVLAWRLGATYVLLAIDEVAEAPRQATMRRIGRRISSLLFRS